MTQLTTESRGRAVSPSPLRDNGGIAMSEDRRPILWLEHESDDALLERMAREIEEVPPHYALGGILQFEDPDEAVEWVRDNPNQAALYIIDLKWAGGGINDGMDGIGAMNALYEVERAPTIFLSAHLGEFAEALTLMQSTRQQVLAMVNKHWHTGDLKTSITQVMATFMETETDAVVKQAVSHIMRYCDFGENKAFISLQKLASRSKKGVKKQEVAQQIVDAVKAVEATDEHNSLMDLLAPTR